MVRPKFQEKTETKTTAPLSFASETKTYGIPAAKARPRIMTLLSHKRD